MNKVIVYQGYNEQFRCRVVDDEGKTLFSTDLFETQEQAIETAEDLAKEYEAEVEVRETIEEVAARDKANAEKQGQVNG